MILLVHLASGKSLHVPTTNREDQFRAERCTDRSACQVLLLLSLAPFSWIETLGLVREPKGSAKTLNRLSHNYSCNKDRSRSQSSSVAFYNPITMSTFLFTSESVNEGHPGTFESFCVCAKDRGASVSRRDSAWTICRIHTMATYACCQDCPYCGSWTGMPCFGVVWFTS